MLKVGEWDAGDVGKIPANLDSGSNVCAILGCVEWVRIWVVITRSDNAESKREQVAHTAAELRALLAAARADKAVWHVRHESRRELVGDKPSHCPAGHDITTRGTLAAPHDWWDCGCGGHWWIQCRQCRAEIMDPPLAYDCQPKTPHRS